MARRRKRNPTTLETVLLTGGGVVIGGIGGFMLASWGCARLLQAAADEMLPQVRETMTP